MSVESAKPTESRKALGRGLSALIGNQPTEAEQKATLPSVSAGISERTIPETTSSILSKYSGYQDSPVKAAEFEEVELFKIEANSLQPRKVFNQSKLEELALSLKEHGLVQPIVVKRLSNQKYQIIAGERRWRAAKLAGLEQIPVIIRSDKKTTEENDLASLVENIQREELSPVELAQAYQRMSQAHGYTQEALSEKLGVSRVSVANTLRLLNLPDDVKEMISNRQISEGHARALLALQNREQISQMALEILNKSMTVREVEGLVRESTETRSRNVSEKGPAGEVKANPEKERVEEELRRIFGAKVNLRGNMVRGSLEIYYSGQDSLNRILHLMRSLENV